MSAWTLKNISPEMYDRLYEGTPAMEVKHLFEREPESDEDALMNFFPSKLWRMNSGIYKIENKEGDLIPFQMNYAQHFVYAHFLKHARLIVLKSRQQRHQHILALTLFRSGYCRRPHEVWIDGSGSG